LPAPLPVAAIAGFQLTESASLWSNLRAPVAVEHPRSLETFGQDYGTVYLNHKLQGTLDRRLKQTHLDISAPEGPVTLDILVENTGRINYGPRLQGRQAGITRSVSLVGHELSG
jgi:beta-galactosidase